jgi:hypothetical protein
MPSLNSLKTVTVKLQEVATPQNKMNVLNLLNSVHKVKRFAKSKSEPAFQVFRKHPITRGMASYLLIWPVGNVIQQILSDQEKFDLWRIARFGLYGCFITAPSLYAWVRLTTAMWPNTTFRIACAKVRYNFTCNPINMNSFCSFLPGTHRTNYLYSFGDVNILFQHALA